MDFKSACKDIKQSAKLGYEPPMRMSMHFTIFEYQMNLEFHQRNTFTHLDQVWMPYFHDIFVLS